MEYVWRPFNRRLNARLTARVKATARVAAEPSSMLVRLIQKLAESIDGIDLSGRNVGDVIEVSPREAHLLIAEGWAELVPGDNGDVQDDMSPPSRKPRP